MALRHFRFEVGHNIFWQMNLTCLIMSSIFQLNGCPLKLCFCSDLHKGFCLTLAAIYTKGFVWPWLQAFCRSNSKLITPLLLNTRTFVFLDWETRFYILHWNPVILPSPKIRFHCWHSSIFSSEPELNCFDIRGNFEFHDCTNQNITSLSSRLILVVIITWAPIFNFRTVKFSVTPIFLSLIAFICICLSLTSGGI